MFIDAFCPYCNYVHKFILRDIQVRRSDINRKLIKEGLTPIPPIEIRVIDVEANYGSIHSRWYEWYSEKIGGKYTPVIKIGDKIFYLEKEEIVENLPSAELLRYQIIKELQDIVERVEKKPSYAKEIKPTIERINVIKANKTGIPAYWR